MPSPKDRGALDVAKARAYISLSANQRQRASLYISRTVVAAAERLGPPFQNIVAEQPSILVFVDDEPRSGHEPSMPMRFSPQL